MIAQEFGRRGQESILLIPGNMMSWRQFEHAIPLLEDEYHVIAISTDGYDGATTFTTAEASAESVEEYLREHLDGSVDLVFGESFGCATAGMLFHRKRVHVGSMILSGPQYMSLGPLNAVLKAHVPRNQRRLIEKIQGRGRLPLLLKLYTRADDEKLLAQFSAVPENISLDTLRNAMEEALRLYEAIDGFTPEPDARVAIWYGAREPNMRKAVRKLKRAFPNAEEHPFVGYGHGEIIAHPDVMASEIRATNQEQRYLDALYTKFDASERATVRGELVVGIAVNAASVIMRLGVVTTIMAGAALILSGEIDCLVYFMFLLMITRVYAPFDQALALIAELLVSEVSAGRLQEIYDEPTADGVEEFSPAGHDIVFDNVSFAYQDETVLDGISFTAHEGEVTALVGPSGSGKSTCARLAARLWDADAGTVTVGGVNVAGIDPETLLSDYSMIFQDVTLFDDTVMENIRLGRRGASDEEVLAAARAANCDEFVERLPQGYATQIGENGSRLSGGERQRISIARALLKDAPILLMDEATASLDVENETRVQEALSRLLAGKTVLVIAHRMRTVENADQIVVLADGKVVEQGTPAQLHAAGGMFAHMAQLQQESAGWSLGA